MIRLQERDKEILTVCYEQQFLLTEHISDHFFGGNYQKALQRVIELRKADFLKPAGFKIGQKLAHTLGPQGLPIALKKSAVELAEYPSFDPKTAEHDAIVTDVRLRLNELWVGRWIPERSIRATDPFKVPDGIFQFANRDQAAIEVENSLKGRKRFENRLEHWPRSGMDFVLYIATKEEIFNALKVFLIKSPEAPPCYLTTLEAIRSNKPMVWSHHYGEVDLFGGRSE